MAGWKDIGKKARETVKLGGEAAEETGAALKGIAVGTGKGAGIATGGVAGLFNGAAKGIANLFLKGANREFALIKRYPRVSAVAVVIVGVISTAIAAIAAVTGIAAWRKRSRIENLQEQEAIDLQASIAANKAARVETSAEMGQGGAFPLRDDWRQRAKGGLPGQRTTS